MARVCRGLAANLMGDYDQALTWAERSFELVDDVNDPDLVADIYASATLPCAARGRFREARRLAGLHDQVASKLTTHHRVHGVAIVVELEELLANWPRIRELELRVVETVEENLATPCVRNPRSLLVCAVAAEVEGDTAQARTLEERAQDLWMEGYGLALDGPRLRLALMREVLEAVSQHLLQPIGARVSTWFHFSATAIRLDALATVGDREAVEAEAPPLLKPRTYLEPFALRALGRVRDDESQLRQALARFEALKLDWHAAHTRTFLQ